MDKAANPKDKKHEEQGLSILKKIDHGMKCVLDGKRSVVFLEGTSEEIGTAHGKLCTSEIDALCRKVAMVDVIHTIDKKVPFAVKMSEIEHRTTPYIPPRFFREMDAMAAASGQTSEMIRQLNLMHELFHCSGAAARGKATVDGNVRHARILDYIRDVGVQSYATLIVTMPAETVNRKKLYDWISVSYAGSVGAITCMNEKGLAIGEKGGGGERKWDGLPMSFLMRRMIEECSTVEEAIALMRSTPLTCDYYYVLSDATNDMAVVVAVAESDDPVHVIRDNEDYPEWIPNKAVMPKKFEDVVYISGPGERIETMAQRLEEYYGKIDSAAMIELMKLPVCKPTNLHNAVFEPVTRDFYFAEARRKTLAANEKYYKANVLELIEFYQKNK